MSNFLVDYDELASFGAEMNIKLNSWNQQLNEVHHSIDRFVQMESFRGAAANSMKSYLSEVHFAIVFSLREIFVEISQRFLLYRDGYYDIDSDLRAQLCEMTQRSLNQFLDRSSNRFGRTSLDVNRSIMSVSDLIPDSPPFALNSAIDREYTSISRNLRVLNENVNRHEQRHHSSDFTRLDQMISALRQYISRCLAMDNDSKGEYLSGSTVDSLEFQELAQAIRDANVEREELSEAFSLAEARELERIEALEREALEAQRRADNISRMVGGALLMVLSGALIVVTKGAATPLVVTAWTVSGGLALFGASEIQEGVNDWNLRRQGDWETVAVNPMRDTIFMGNQQAYDFTRSLFVHSAGVLMLGTGASTAYLSAGGHGLLQFGGRVAFTYAASHTARIGTTEIATQFGMHPTNAETLGTVAGVGTAFTAGRYAFRAPYSRPIPRVNATSPANVRIGNGSNQIAGRARVTGVQQVNRLPNFQNAHIDPNKVSGYALNQNHPVGANKARVFDRALGFNQSNANQLTQQVKQQLPRSEAVMGRSDQFGQRFTVDMQITGPNGNTATVRTGWIIDTGSNAPRLTTMYVR